jgi:hypothetical protein
MFPYGMIVAANMLNKKGERQTNVPRITTLNEYTELTPQQFYDLLTIRAQGAGICEMANMISNWQGFDSLSAKQKVKFVTETIDPEYYSLVSRVKRFFKK